LVAPLTNKIDHLVQTLQTDSTLAATQTYSFGAASPSACVPVVNTASQFRDDFNCTALDTNHWQGGYLFRVNPSNESLAPCFGLTSCIWKNSDAALSATGYLVLKASVTKNLDGSLSATTSDLHTFRTFGYGSLSWKQFVQFVQGVAA
jgi:hypothetical protein